MSRPRIGLITAWDPRTPAWASGISYYMARALSQLVEVVPLGPAFSWRELIGKIRGRAMRAVGLRPDPYMHGEAIAREYARIFNRRIARNVDALFAPMSATQIAYLETSLPIVYTSDTTFALLKDYYPEYSNLSARYAHEADQIEARAIQRARALPYPSAWAADSAVRDYHAPRERVSVLPWGANLDEVPEASEILPAKMRGKCRLLFLGKDWERKGGPLAYETTLELRRRGVNARLTVCGCSPPGPFEADAAEIVGHIDKADPVQRNQLRDLLLRAHFLLQPTRFESLGVVYCEASAHGTPSLATATGGVGGVIFDGENGFRLPLTSGSKEYADLIQRSMEDWDGYQRLVKSTRNVFETRLNWGVWAAAMKSLF